MRQLIYVSSGTSALSEQDLVDILASSRLNNLRDGVTGLLYFDGRRFLQVLEGQGRLVTDTLLRIERDPRHRALVRLSDREVAAREFGCWSMAHLKTGADHEVFVRRVAELVQGASPNVRATFTGFADLRRAA